MSIEQEITIEDETIIEEEEDEITIIEERKAIEIIEQMDLSNGPDKNLVEPESSEPKNDEESGLSKPNEDEQNVEPELSKPVISFGVKIQKKKTIERTNLLVHREEDDEVEVEPKRMKLTHFEDGVATGHEDSKTVKKKTDYVIPMVIRNDWRVERLRKMEADGTITEEDRARLSILLEAQGGEQIMAEETVSRKVIVLKPEEIESSEDADYSQIPIEHFGLAMLRGCGWKEGEGIGKTNKKAVPLKLPELRPKGLGLGAQLPKIETKKAESDKPEDQIKPLGRGSFVKVVGEETSSNKKSKYANRYGVVKAMDEDNSSCLVELAIDHSIVRISQFILEPVSAREYKDKSRILNVENYDRVRRELDKNNADDVYKNGDAASPKIRKTSSRRDLEELEKSSRIKEEYSNEPTSTSSKMWAMPHLRVRFVDKRYKDGAYFKQKMVIVEASDKYNVELRDDRGKMHYNIKQNWLETVIPKGLGGNVRIVSGPYKGNIGLIAERDDRKERIWVRLLNSDDLVKVSYDDACEWVGNEEELY